MNARLRGLRSLVHDAIEVITNLVEETQSAEAKRVVDVLSVAPPVGEGAAAVETARKAIAGAVFDSVRRINRGVQSVTDLASAALEQAVPDQVVERIAKQIDTSTAETLTGFADNAQAALNAVVGDFLAARANGLAIPMGFAQAGATYALTRESLGQVLATPTPKIAVFVHGLGCNESSWRIGAEAHLRSRAEPRASTHGDKDANYGAFLARDLGFTPLYLRYNTGLHISLNGRELAQQLDALVEAYPVPVREIALIGYSMGGLVVRSAAHYAAEQKRPWLAHLKHIVCIGSPNLGAPLEKASNVLSSLLGMVEVAGTQVPKKILNARSAGIKDLRFGYIADEDWTDKDPDTLLTDASRDVPLVDGVSYAFIAASLLAEGERGSGLVGDIMVRLPSSTGRGEGTRQLEFHMGHIVYGVNHLGLLNHPDVYTQLRAFLEDKIGAPPTPATEGAA